MICLTIPANWSTLFSFDDGFRVIQIPILFQDVWRTEVLSNPTR